MSMGGGTTTTNSAPWSGAQPYLLDVMKQAQSIYSGGGQLPGVPAPSGGNASGGGGSFIPGIVGAIMQQHGIGGAGSPGGGGTPPMSSPGIAGGYASQYPDLSSTTQDALSRISDRAITGSPLLQTAQNTVQNFAGGGATNNPFLDQMFGRAADQVRNYTNAGATMAGRRGSGANQDILGKNIGDLAASMYGNAYETGQNRQLAAAQLAPNLANQDFIGLQQLLGAGQMYDTQNLAQYNAPWDALSHYAGAVSGLGGLGGTSTQKAPSQSIFPSLLGAGLQALPFLL